MEQKLIEPNDTSTEVDEQWTLEDLDERDAPFLKTQMTNFVAWVKQKLS